VGRESLVTMRGEGTSHRVSLSLLEFLITGLVVWPRTENGVNLFWFTLPRLPSPGEPRDHLSRLHYCFSMLVRRSEN
jgi:hypothetical protein